MSFVFRGQTTIPDRPSDTTTTRPMIYSHLRSTIRLSDHPTILPTDHPDGPSGRPTIRHVLAERPSDRPSHRPTIPHTPTIRHAPPLRSTDDRPTTRPTDHPEGPSDHLTDRSPRRTIRPNDHPIDRPSEQPTDSPTLAAPAWTTTANRTQTFPPLRGVRGRLRGPG